MFSIAPNTLLKKILITPFFFLIIAAFLIPSDGNHGFFSPKSLAYLLTIGSLTLLITAQQGLKISQVKMFAFLLISLCFLTTWLILSTFQIESTFHTSWDQFKVFWITLSVVGFSYYLVSQQLLKLSSILKVIIYANFTYSALKITLVGMHLLNLINMWTILSKLGIQIVSMQILGNIERIQTSPDIATPFILFFFLQAPQINLHFSKKFRYLFVIISLISIFLSFSRFLMFVAFLSLFLNSLTGKIQDFFKFGALLTIVFALSIFTIGLQNSYDIFEKRFLSKDNTQSDETRIEQIEALMEELYENPFLGKGLGGYSLKVIRENTNLHVYEVQWVAFLMQFGLIGILGLISCMIIISANILTSPLTRPKVALFILFCTWLISGFTNPFLISLTSGMFYALFLLFGKEIGKYPLIPKC